MQPTPDTEAVPDRSLLQRFCGLLNRLETAVLCILLTGMILLACTQILLRSVFSGGLLWADPLLRYMVLWSGLLGASLAVSRGSHISLDLADYILPDRFRPFIELVCNLFSTIVAGLLGWAGILFLRDEIAFGSEALFNLPSWVWNLIFPLAFILISLRYFIQLILSGMKILKFTTEHRASC